MEDTMIDYFFSGNQYIRVTRCDTGPGTVDAGYPAPISRWNWGTFGANGINAALYSGGPSAGLGSNSNYLLYSAGAQPGTCNNLTGLSVTINIDTDLVGSIGFGFQLNAYSPKGNQSAWQQYVMTVINSAELTGAVDNWPVSGANLINNFFSLLSLPSSNKLSAGYQLTIALENDTTGNVTGARYIVVDNHGNTQADVTKSLLSISGVTAADLAPITAFEINLVGPDYGLPTNLSSGAGTITYAASSLLTVLNAEPACTESGYITAETANSFYGLMPSSPDYEFTQSFSASTLQPMIQRPGNHILARLHQAE